MNRINSSCTRGYLDGSNLEVGPRAFFCIFFFFFTRPAASRSAPPLATCWSATSPAARSQTCASCFPRTLRRESLIPRGMCSRSCRRWTTASPTRAWTIGRCRSASPRCLHLPPPATTSSEQKVFSPSLRARAEHVTRSYTGAWQSTSTFQEVFQRLALQRDRCAVNACVLTPQRLMFNTMSLDAIIPGWFIRCFNLIVYF